MGRLLWRFCLPEVNVRKELTEMAGQFITFTTGNFQPLKKLQLSGRQTMETILQKRLV